jgi:maltose O-acetyltransferase
MDNKTKDVIEIAPLLVFRPNNADVVEKKRNARLIFEEFNKTSIDEKEKRAELIKKLFGKIGKYFWVEPTFKCDYGFNISVGENFYANFDCIFLDIEKITIGDNCFVAPQVSIYTATHPLDAIERVNSRAFGKPVTIGNNCWLGGRAIINPGVVLGNNVVVASGSVVTKSFGDNVLIGGNPAKIIKKV